VSDRINAAPWKLIAQASGLLLFGIVFEALFVAAEARLPRNIYFDASCTRSLIKRVPLAFILALLSLVFFGWLFTPASRDRRREGSTEADANLQRIHEAALQTSQSRVRSL